MLFRLSAVVVLFAFWLLLSGHFTPFLIAAGVGCSIAVVAFGWRMRVIDREGFPVHLGLRVLGYWPWLGVEIVKSGWQVARLILDPRLPVSPTLTSFAPTQTTSVGLVIHANSITLTPGTITVEAEPGRFVVHGLTRASAEATVASEMDRRVSACEARR